jgi:transposase
MRESMEIYPRTAAERAMKLQEVLLRTTAGKIKWWQAAELIGISERQMRRWQKRLEEQGPKGLLDQRRGTPSQRRIPREQAEEVLLLYRDQYFDLNVRHFHEKLREEHQIGLSYTWVKQALQGARPGEAQGQARGASQTAGAASSARHAAAHRWQRSSMVSG